jgi:hypothetical protein
MLLDGLYTGGPWNVSQPYQTLKAVNKWGAKFYNIAGGNGVITVPDGVGVNGNGTVVDGLAFSNCQSAAVYFRQMGLSNCVMRNCWVQHTGKTWGRASGGQSGMQSYAGVNLLVENNLLEWNGADNPTGFNHGIYAGGTNAVIRNNVCRYNDGYGISIDTHSEAYRSGGRYSDVGCQIYNNLLYGNSNPETGNAQLEVYDDTLTAPPAGPFTNYIFGNTLVSSGAYAIMLQGGPMVIQNNLVLSTGEGIHRWNAFLGEAVMADYNLAPQTISVSGPHDVITNYSGLRNTGAGLYWLKSDSPSRGKALSSAFGSVDFFGHARSSVADIGAFQYNAAYASDARVLDPSPANPDYWANLAGTNGGSAAITVTPANWDFGTIPVGTNADQTFTVQNTGSAALSGSASVSAPFSIVSGGSYTLAAGLGQAVIVRYSPTTAGSDSATVTFSGGDGATVSVSGTATAAPGALTFPASSGSLSSPFVAANGYIYQPAETDVTTGGKAVYSFTVTNAGDYLIQALVNASDSGANSFYINMDAQPQDPTMIWDVPLTTGFEQRTVSWRGNGTDVSDQFAPKFFSLAVGPHQLIIVGREANTQLEQVSIVSVPPPPQNLRIMAGR